MNFDAYRNHIKSLQRTLTHADEIALADRIAEGDEDAIHELVEANLYYALTYAERFYKSTKQPNEGLETLVRAANEGLYRAARAYSSGDGKRYRFRKYAAWWMRQRMAEVNLRP